MGDELGEQGQDLLAHRISEDPEGPVAGMEAFAGGVFGEDDLMRVEQKVVIGDAPTLLARDLAIIDEVERCGEHLSLPEQQLGPRALDQHPVLG